MASYNKYKEGKIVDDAVNPEDVDYLALDFRVSYDLNMILGDTGFFDPYVGIPMQIIRVGALIMRLPVLEHGFLIIGDWISVPQVNGP
jgi:hypothetical protein